MPKTFQVVIRVEPEVVDRADEVAELLSKQAGPGLGTTRTAVMRAALIRGLDVLAEDGAGTGQEKTGGTMQAEVSGNAVTYALPGGVVVTAKMVAEVFGISTKTAHRRLSRGWIGASRIPKRQGRS